jgi:uncharacterized membrane protein YgaE (UPF0421/DUF939 family)
MRDYIPSIQLSSRAALAATLSVAIAQWLQFPSPLYAMIAAVIVTDLSPAKTRELGIPRIIGTCLGAFSGALAVRWLPSEAWAVGVAVVVPMFLCHAWVMKESGRLAGYLAGLVVLTHSGNPWFYAIDRVVETLLGIGVAVFVSLAPKLLNAEDETPRAVP